MGILQQIRDALRGQIEDFFRVQWQAVALMLVIIAGVIDCAYLRFNYGPSMFHRTPFWSVHAILGVGVWLALLNLKRFLR